MKKLWRGQEDQRKPRTSELFDSETLKHHSRQNQNCSASDGGESLTCTGRWSPRPRPTPSRSAPTRASTRPREDADVTQTADTDKK